jgi:hypothetical protein
MTSSSKRVCRLLVDEQVMCRAARPQARALVCAALRMTK